MSEERILLGGDEAARKLQGKTIVGAEFCEGETEDEDYIVLVVGDLTVYANKPSVYAPAKQRLVYKIAWLFEPDQAHSLDGRSFESYEVANSMASIESSDPDHPHYFAPWVVVATTAR